MATPASDHVALSSVWVWRAYPTCVGLCILGTQTRRPVVPSLAGGQMLRPQDPGQGLLSLVTGSGLRDI